MKAQKEISQENITWSAEMEKQNTHSKKVHWLNKEA